MRMWRPLARRRPRWSRLGGDWSWLNPDAQALAHSLDEHKRLVAAKQEQEMLLATHFKSINLGEPKG